MALVHCLANYASVREGHSNSSSSRRRPGPIGAMGTGLRRCDGVAARSPTASLGGETPGGSPLVTPIARHYTGGKLVCSGRVAVGLHRRIALFPGPGRAVRGIRDCCEPTILYNQRGSPWPDLVRGPSAHGLDPWASTSSVGKLSLPQVVDARDEPGQGAFGSRIRCKTPASTALQLSPDSPAGFRGVTITFWNVSVHFGSGS